MLQRAMAIICVCLTCSPTLVFSQTSEEKPDPVLRDRIEKAIIVSGKLWLLGGMVAPPRDLTGGLIALNLADGMKEIHFQRSIIDIAKISGEVWALRSEGTRQV